MISAKRVLEKCTGLKIERCGDAFAVYKQPAQAWWSLKAQMQSALARHGIDLVLDVGANRGQFASRLRNVYAGDIISFEPVTKAYDVLTQRADADPRWEAVQIALGDQTGTLDINVFESDEFNSFLAANDYAHQRFAQYTKHKHTESVKVRKLHDVLVERRVQDRRMFLKLDTQGFDLMAFRGAGESLKNVSMLLSEVSLMPIYDGAPHWTESVRAYEQAGFSVVGLFPVNHDNGRIVEYDCLMSR